MPLKLRMIATSAIVLSALSCSRATDAPTMSRATERASAQLAIAPTLSANALHALGALGAQGVDITNIRITLVDLGGRVTLDTIVAFPITTDTITVLLPLSIQGREQQFNATIQLRDASGAVQFSSTQRVTARDASLPALPAAAITLQYVGPGFRAKVVTVAPGDASILPTATQQLNATATDAAGAPVGDLAVVWTTSDSTIARVISTSSVTAIATPRGPRGTVTFTARALTGVIGTAKLTVLPQAARLAVISGNGQTAVSLQALAIPMTVEVQATDGGKVAGALVTFRSATAGGDVTTVSARSDSTGRATTVMKLGRNAGAYVYEATSGSLAPVTVGATAIAPAVGPPSQLIPLTPLPASFKVGVASTQVFSAQVADANGYYLAQPGISFTVSMVVSPSGARSSVTALSDAQGVVSMSIPAFSSAGTVTISLSSPTIPNLPYGTFTIVP